MEVQLFPHYVIPAQLSSISNQILSVDLPVVLTLILYPQEKKIDSAWHLGRYSIKILQIIC